jgi:nucleotide-binding universal stress UspA family protein
VASLARLSRIAINRILLATDFSSEAEKALECAIALARRYESTLVVAHVLPFERAVAAGEGWPALLESAKGAAQATMQELVVEHDLKSIPHEVLITAGDACAELFRELHDENIDLLIMGTHGLGGFKKLLLGSTAEKVIRHATCPVLTVGPHFRLVSLNRFGHIVFATDFSPGSQNALLHALSLAEQDRAELTMLHVIESIPVSDVEMMEWKQDDRRKLNQMIPKDLDLAYNAEIEVEVGIPEEEIIRLADTRKADLIVMGSHSGGALSTHLPWTTLHYVLHHAHCPVLTVRS